MRAMLFTTEGTVRQDSCQFGTALLDGIAPGEAYSVVADGAAFEGSAAAVREFLTSRSTNKAKEG